MLDQIWGASECKIIFLRLMQSARQSRSAAEHRRTRIDSLEPRSKRKKKASRVPLSRAEPEGWRRVESPVILSSDSSARKRNESPAENAANMRKSGENSFTMTGTPLTCRSSRESLELRASLIRESPANLSAHQAVLSQTNYLFCFFARDYPVDVPCPSLECKSRVAKTGCPLIDPGNSTRPVVQNGFDGVRVYA